MRRPLAAAVLAGLAVAASAPATAAADRPPTWDASAVASHAMLYLNSPPAFRDAMFREAAASGATSLRVDVPLPAVVTGPRGERSWSELEDIARLARRYRIEVVGLVYGSPWWLADCPPGFPEDEYYKCRPKSARAFARLAGDIARHTRGTIDTWQVLNEPNNRFVFTGDVHDYARVLIATSAAIRRANPAARIVLGGLGGPTMQTWPARLLAIPGTRRAFDVASVHLRGRLKVVRSAVDFWRERFDSLGFRGPIWATEHGYPTDPEFQWDTRFRGVAGQARYLRRSLPALIGEGIDRVFITLRDNRGGPWATEGLIGGTVFDPPSAAPVVERKPAALAVRRFAMSLLAPVPRGDGVASPPSLAQAPAGGLRTDRSCYAPGAVMKVTGRGFLPGRDVQLMFLATGGRAARRLAARAPVTVRGDGTFAARYRAPAIAVRRGTLRLDALPAHDSTPAPFASALARSSARLGTCRGAGAKAGPSSATRIG